MLPKTHRMVSKNHLVKSFLLNYIKVEYMIGCLTNLELSNYHIDYKTHSLLRINEHCILVGYRISYLSQWSSNQNTFDIIHP